MFTVMKDEDDESTECGALDNSIKRRGVREGGGEEETRTTGPMHVTILSRTATDGGL